MWLNTIHTIYLSWTETSGVIIIYAWRNDYWYVLVEFNIKEVHKCFGIILQFLERTHLEW